MDTLGTILIRGMSSFRKLISPYVAGTMDSVLIKGVSLFTCKRLFCTHLYVARTVDSVLIEGMSSFQKSLCTHLKRFPYFGGPP